MAARKSLLDALEVANRGAQPRPAAEPDAIDDAESPQLSVVPSRVNTKHFGVYIDPVAHKQLKHLAVENSSSLQELGIEALNMLFAKYGMPEIATPNKPKRRR